MSGLRVALLDGDGSEYSRDLESALRREGCQASRVESSSLPPLESLLRRRGFTPALTRVPLAVAELLRGEFDLAHAFSAPDAVAALACKRVRGCPVVFTCTEALDRGTVADARLRVWTLAQALAGSDAIVAATDSIQESVERWLAYLPSVIAADDAVAHERLYRELLAQRRS